MNYKGKKHLINKRNEKSKKKQIKKTKKANSLNFLNLVKKKLRVKLKQKYDCNKKKYELFLVDYLLNNANCHMVTVFKDKMISDYIEEFMHRKYDKNECEERMPKYYYYYKNYLNFFCKPTFKDMKLNEIIQNNGEQKAELYYKKNYLKSKSFDDMKDCGFEKSDTESSSDSQKSSKDNNDNIIFNKNIKEKLDNNTVLTTISNGINKTMNLNIDNEKIEVFCENKYDISNDTTVVDFIDDYQKEIEKNKSKKKKITYKTLKNKINDKKKLLNKKYLKKSNEKNRKNEKMENFLNIYFSNSKQKQNKIELVKNKNDLQLFYKRYNKYENELNAILRNYKNNIKNKFNKRTTTTTVSSTPHYNYNLSDIKSRNKKRLIFNKTSIQTNYVYTSQNKNNKDKTVYKIKDNKKNNGNKRCNSNNTTTVNIKIKRKIKDLNDKLCENYSKKKHKRVKNLSIKTEKTYKPNNKNDILLNSGIENNYEKNKKDKDFIDSTKDCHQIIKIIKIHKNDKLFPKNNNNITKNRNKSITTNEINKNNLNTRNNNFSKDNTSKKTKTNKKKIYKKSRNYGSCSSLSSVNNQYNNTKNKSIIYTSMSNINYYINNTNRNIKMKTQNNLNKNKNNKSNYKKKGSNITHISFPLLSNNKNTSPYHRTYNKKKRVNNYAKSVSNIFDSNSKKIKNNSKSINKTELINSSSNKSNKYRKTIMS